MWIVIRVAGQTVKNGGEKLGGLEWEERWRASNYRGLCTQCAVYYETGSINISRNSPISGVMRTFLHKIIACTEKAAYGLIHLPLTNYPADAPRNSGQHVYNVTRSLSWIR